MNAVAETHVHAVALPHATHKLKLLIKREFWENKGGFLWAPIIVGGIATTFAALAAIAGTIMGRRHGIGDSVDADDVAEVAKVLGAVGDGALLAGVGLAMAVLAFVVFFYALGSLYDDRRDRSILFWKSMPVSDAQIVLSKAAWALVLAPLVAVAIGLIIGLAFWLIVGLTTTVNSVPGAGGIIVNSHPFRIVANILVSLPVQMLWSLPTLGWLMLCSAWSRRVPFLWATMVPILFCTMVSFMGIFPQVDIPHDWLWYTVVYRGLLSVVPGSWIPPTFSSELESVHGPDQLPDLLHIGSSWQVMANADVWIGAILGVAMIYGAIRLRRWREEG